MQMRRQYKDWGDEATSPKMPPEAGRGKEESFLRAPEGAHPAEACISRFPCYERMNTCCLKATKCVVACSRLRERIQECMKGQSLWLKACTLRPDFPSSILTSPVISVYCQACYLPSQGRRVHSVKVVHMDCVWHE